MDANFAGKNGDSLQREERPAQNEAQLRPRFELGRVCITPAAAEIVPPDLVQLCLRRHALGDWGELSPADREENEFSLREGFRLLSSFKTESGENFWIITEADRSVTTILLPSDY